MKAHRIASRALARARRCAAATAERHAGPTAKATFAGGCFWCVEADFDKVPGVMSTTSGYTGGKVANPTYEQVSASGTGHAEAVQVVFDPAKVSYEKLLEHFWRNIDPDHQGPPVLRPRLALPHRDLRPRRRSS